MSVHALRLYEREGLLAGPVRRDAGGRRVYTEWDVEWLLYCTKFRAAGCTPNTWPTGVRAPSGATRPHPEPGQGIPPAQRRRAGFVAVIAGHRTETTASGISSRLSPR
ncbi:MerR family transcriptional regulator [Amycolatopsis sp. DG1A-15b]|uniref:MerR family transcriptional regulator n=1 Tax=Amycolatopsis sp. DG1A-15b TaxID=3052846 RepID=UPI00255BE3E0|nr:MerR family transcriptional regulator [Amycolatopsis sp. DG1A-15b]WIX93350.1 MerR family transcriptional regulator [Amycolatopsis sp. DG1A-15b]